MTTYTPHTQDDIESMLSVIGLNNIDQLFDTIPDALRLQRDLEIPKGMSEFDVADHAAD